jgi:hypothetical protein
MKVFCPSHGRPDTALFEIAHDLNIVLQFEEDVEPYSKWQGKHNVIYVPELTGLLDARNWILENNNEWILMIDDDVSLFHDEDYNILDWDVFLSRAEDIIKQIESSSKNYAMITINNRLYETFIDHFSMDERNTYTTVTYPEIYQVIFLNCRLIKSKSLRYEGYPYDGYNGKKSYSEDINMSSKCLDIGLQLARINYLFCYGNALSSTCWDNNRYTWFLLTNIWLYEKYNHNSKLRDVFRDKIITFFITLLQHTNKKAIEEIPKYIKYKNENGEETKEMNKLVIQGLFRFILEFMGTSFPKNEQTKTSILPLKEYFKWPKKFVFNKQDDDTVYFTSDKLKNATITIGNPSDRPSYLYVLEHRLRFELISIEDGTIIIKNLSDRIDTCHKTLNYKTGYYYTLCDNFEITDNKIKLIGGNTPDFANSTFTFRQ